MNVHDALPAYALGALEPDEAARVAAALRSDPALAAELAAIEADLAGLAEALPPVPPPPALRARLLDSAALAARFDGFAQAVAGLIDATADRARLLLRHLGEPSVWRPLMPGVAVVHVRPGPAVAGQDVGFVRLAPGTVFPEHRHLGDERVLVLQGRMRDSDGTEVGPGERADRPAGSAHAFSAVGNEPLLYLVVVGGVEIPGVTPEEPPEADLL